MLFVSLIERYCFVESHAKLDEKDLCGDAVLICMLESVEATMHKARQNETVPFDLLWFCCKASLSEQRSKMLKAI